MTRDGPSTGILFSARDHAGPLLKASETSVGVPDGDLPVQ